MKLSDQETHYLNAILRRLREFRDAVPVDDLGFSLGSMALDDEIDWLDCFIDEHTREE